MAYNAFASFSKKMKVANQDMMTAIVASCLKDVMENAISFFLVEKAVSCGLTSKRFKNT